MDLHQEIDNIDDFNDEFEVNFALVDQADDNVVLPIHLTNITGTCLQQLNTDCLMEIFSNNSLTLTDLCSIAETCTRFKQIAELIFPKDLSVTHDCDEDYTCYLESKKFGEYWCCIEEVERVLKNFGKYISVVSMCCDELMKSIAKYCGTATLQRLHIGWLHCGKGKGLTIKLKSVLQRMLVLSFDNCDLMTLVPCPYINCDSLIELEITSSSGCVTVLRNTFPKLERFTFYGNFIFSESYDEHYSEILPNFLRRHKRLVTLHLSSESVCCSSQLMETIDNNCTELVNLTLERWHSPKTSFNFAYLKNLCKLSMLAVRLDEIDHRQLIALLEVLMSLTTLKLSYLYEEVPQLFVVLSQLPNLLELHLMDCHFGHIPWSRLTQLKALHLQSSLSKFSASHLLQIIRKLTNLEELLYTNDDYEEDSFELSSEGFSEIVKIVERRPNKLTLRCYLSENLKKNYVPNKNVNLIEYTDSD